MFFGLETQTFYWRSRPIWNYVSRLEAVTWDDWRDAMGHKEAWGVMRYCDVRRHEALEGVIRSGPPVFVKATPLGWLGLSASLLHNRTTECAWNLRLVISVLSHHPKMTFQLRRFNVDTATVICIACSACMASLHQKIPTPKNTTLKSTDPFKTSSLYVYCVCVCACVRMCAFVCSLSAVS